MLGPIGGCIWSHMRAPLGHSLLLLVILSIINVLWYLPSSTRHNKTLLLSYFNHKSNQIHISYLISGTDIHINNDKENTYLVIYFKSSELLTEWRLDKMKNLHRYPIVQTIQNIEKGIVKWNVFFFNYMYLVNLCH